LRATSAIPNLHKEFIAEEEMLASGKFENIEAIVTWLRDKGVVLEKYPFVQIVNSESGPLPPVTR